VVYHQSVHLGNKPLETHDHKFFFRLNTCYHSPYVTSSLTRGWVCCLQLLLALTKVVILRSASRGTDDHILLSLIRDSPNLEDQVPVFISPRNRVAQLYPKHLVPFLSPSMTYRVTVEVFNPASTQDLIPAGLGSSLYSLRADPQKTPFPSLSQQYLDCCLLIRCHGNVFAETLPSNERLLWLHYSSFQASCCNNNKSWNHLQLNMKLCKYIPWLWK
jgi:hypothetical protein